MSLGILKKYRFSSRVVQVINAFYCPNKRLGRLTIADWFMQFVKVSHKFSIIYIRAMNEHCSKLDVSFVSTNWLNLKRLMHLKILSLSSVKYQLLGWFATRWLKSFSKFSFLPRRILIRPIKLVIEIPPNQNYRRADQHDVHFTEMCGFHASKPLFLL